MINKLENTNTPSATNPQFCLMGPKVNVCHLAIEWELETQEWLAKAERPRVRPLPCSSINRRIQLSDRLASVRLSRVFACLI
jgi:hypothetical protein